MTRSAFAWILMSAGLVGCDKIDTLSGGKNKIESRVETVETSVGLLELSKKVESLQEEIHKANASSPKAPYNDCVLDHMNGVNSDLAVSAVKEACLRMASVPIDDLKSIRTSKSVFSKGKLFIYFNNLSSYTITNIKIIVINKQSHEVNYYPKQEFPPPDVVELQRQGRMGPLADRTYFMRLEPGQSIFVVEISESAPDSAKWNELFGWDFASASGYIN